MLNNNFPVETKICSFVGKIPVSGNKIMKKTAKLMFIFLCSLLALSTANVTKIGEFSHPAQLQRAIFNYFPKKCPPGLIWKYGFCRQKLQPKFNARMLLKLITGFHQNTVMYVILIYNS